MEAYKFQIFWFSLGWVCGCLAIWRHFYTSHMLRTKHEWWCDPRVQERYPIEAKEYFMKYEKIQDKLFREALKRIGIDPSEFPRELENET